MSIVKDLYPIITVILSSMLFVYVCYLQKKLIIQRECFVETLTHDFRVSLLALLQGLKLLDSGVAYGKDCKDIISESINSCKYTIDMVTMLSAAYKFENGEDIFKPAPINITSVINALWTNFETLAKMKNVSLNNNNEYVIVNAEAEYILKAIEILLEISVKNSANNNMINCDISSSIDEIIINISFIGKSLTDEELRRMFSNHPNFSTVGHGIKMFLCKKIIEFHKGKLLYKITGNNVIKFTIKLPSKHISNPVKLPVLLTAE